MATRYGLPIADSALQLISWGVRRDGVYLLNLPIVGRTKVFCLLDQKWDGGGWMMMMKATNGTTFSYYSNYWTSNNTLNAEQTNQNNGDAKFDVMNYYQGKDFLARWPDISQGGSIQNLGAWIWLQNNYNNGARITPTSFFSTADLRFIKHAKTFDGWAEGVFSSQVDINFYGFNFRNGSSEYYDIPSRVRWGFGFNENGEGLYVNESTLYNSEYAGSNDVSGGIGLDSGFGYFSAGDVINCCEDTVGINRSARVEVYVR